MTAKPTPIILVVDDERDFRELAGEMLTQAGYEVVLAADGAEAITAANASRIDLIVMDMRMPVMDGLTATRQLKADVATAGIPILALTGAAGDEMRQEATDAGCDTFIGKPINPMAFISLIRHWVPR